MRDLKVKKMVKANASTITSKLGGGGYGHLGLILTVNEYATVLNTSYVRPVRLGKLQIPNVSTQHAATTLKEQHKMVLSL